MNESTKTLTVYTDGSYDPITGVYGCSVIIPRENGNPEVLKKTVQVTSIMHSGKSSSAELDAAAMAMKYAVKHGYKEINLNTDCELVINCITGKASKTKKEYLKRFIQKFDSYHRELIISTNKIAAHTGDTYNSLADKVAKTAAGLRLA